MKKYFKMMEKDMTTCDGFQYEIGGIYELDGEIEACKNGFHFSDRLDELLKYYEDNKGIVRWDVISSAQKLPESFIERNKNLVFWNNISIHQDLSEDFIMAHENRVNWYWILKYQRNISEDFIEENLDRVDWSYEYAM